MRYLTIVGLCLLTFTMLGCSGRPQSATSPGEEGASSGESAPAPDNATEARKDSAARDTNESATVRPVSMMESAITRIRLHKWLRSTAVSLVGRVARTSSPHLPVETHK